MTRNRIDEAKQHLIQGDGTKAAELLLELIRTDEPARKEALTLMGVSILEGMIPGRDEAEALALLDEAARLGDGEAAAALWETTKKDPYRAILIQTAAAGDLSAIDCLAKSEGDGFFALFGYVPALELLKRAAQDDRLDAMLLLAKTEHIERNREEAKRLWRRAAMLDRPEGHVGLASLSNDTLTQIGHYEAAARLGHVESMRYLEAHYAKTNQHDQRMRVLAMLADRGDEAAILRLFDDGVEKGQFEQAIAYANRLHQKPASLVFRMASLFDRIGDENEAFCQYDVAARSGVAAAMLELGIRYLQGKGTVPNEKLAATWIAAAAERSHPEAMYRLGCLYETGIGVQKDASLAVFWLENAASYGHKEAKIMIEALDKTIRPSKKYHV